MNWKCWIVGHSREAVNRKQGVERCTRSRCGKLLWSSPRARRLLSFALFFALLMPTIARAQVGTAVNIVDGPTGRKARVTTAGALTVDCDNCSGGGTSGGLTNAQLRASPVPVSGDFSSAGLTNTQLRLTPVVVQASSGTVAISSVAGTVLVDGSGHAQPVTGTFWQATQPVSIAGTVAVSGTFWQATQPVSGPLTDAQLRASAVPVSGTFFQATQPVSGPLTDTQLRATAVPVSGTVTATGPLTDTQLRASAVPISASALPLPSGAATDRATAAAPGAVRLSDGAAFYNATTPSDTQPVSASSLPLPSGASTEATLALIKAKTDNIDVALSTRTKPADSQTVTGTVAATQSGTWTVQPGNTANTTAWKVDGSGVTQPVSGTVTVTDGSGALNVIVDSSALPSGAATAAKQPALGTAGTASVDVLTVQGKSGMTALVVDGSGVTQPISGAVTGSGNFTVVQATGTNLHTVVDSAPTTAVTNAGLSNLDVALSTRLKPADTLTKVTTVDTITNPVTITDGAGALNVIVDSSALPSGAATDSSVTGLEVTQGSTTSGQSGVLAQGAVTTSEPAYTTAKTSPLSLSTAGGLRVGALTHGSSTSSGARMVGSLGGLANATTPTYSEGTIDFLSVDLGGRIRTALNTPFNSIGVGSWSDTFDMTLNTTTTWNSFSSGLGSAPVASSSILTLLNGATGATPGPAQIGSSYVQSQAKFPPVNPGWLVFSATAKTAGTVNCGGGASEGLFIGLGTTSGGTGLPLTDAVGFEGTSTGWNAVIYNGGTAVSTTSIANPAGGAFHNFYIFTSSESVYWFVDSLVKPVATVTLLTPGAETLPVLLTTWVNDPLNSGSASCLIGNFTFHDVSVGVSAFSPTDTTSTVALGSLNAQANVSLQGQHGAGFILSAGTLLGTIVPEISYDGGVTYTATEFDNQTTNAKVPSLSFYDAVNGQITGSIVMAAGASHARVRVSNYVSGTANCTIRASQVNDPSVLFTGAVGSSTQPPTIGQIGGWDGRNLHAVAVDATGSLIVHEAMTPPAINNLIPRCNAVRRLNCR